MPMLAGLGTDPLAKGTQKPPLGYALNSADTLADGLVFCWTFQDYYGGAARDLVNKRIITAQGTTIRQVTSKGPCVTFSGSAGEALRATIIGWAGNYTFSCWLRLNATETAEKQIVAFGAGAANAVGLTYGVSGKWLHWDGGYFTHSLVPVANVWYYVTICRDSAAKWIYVNGGRPESSSVGANNIGASVTFGADTTDPPTSRNIAATLADAWLWNRRLSPAEIARHCQQTYSLITGPVHPLWLAAATSRARLVVPGPPYVLGRNLLGGLG